VKNILRTNNQLLIRFFSAKNKVDSIAQSKLPSVLPDNPRVYARKAQYHFGWDWGPTFITCGIWKKVYLEACDKTPEEQPFFNSRKVELVQGGLVEGFKSKAPYDVIFINGAIEQVPDTLLAQLAEGGRLVCVLKDGQSRAWLYLKENGQVGRRPDFDADVPVLAGFKKAMGFVF